MSLGGSKPKTPEPPPPPPAPPFTPTRADASVTTSAERTPRFDANSLISSGSARGELTQAKTKKRTLIGGS